MEKFSKLEVALILMIAVSALIISIKTLKNKKLVLIEQKVFTFGFQRKDWIHYTIGDTWAILVGMLLLLSSMTVIFYLVVHYL